MKRAVCLWCALVLVVGLCACGEKNVKLEYDGPGIRPDGISDSVYKAAEKMVAVADRYLNMEISEDEFKEQCSELMDFMGEPEDDSSSDEYLSEDNNVRRAADRLIFWCAEWHSTPDIQEVTECRNKLAEGIGLRYGVRASIESVARDAIRTADDYLKGKLPQDQCHDQMQELFQSMENEKIKKEFGANELSVYSGIKIITEYTSKKFAQNDKANDTAKRMVKAGRNSIAKIIGIEEIE